MVQHDGKELKWPPAASRTGDILVRWLAYADDTCILAESMGRALRCPQHLQRCLGTKLSAEKSFWMTLGCSIDGSDRAAIQLSCGPIKYADSLKYLGVELTSDLTDIQQQILMQSCPVAAAHLRHHQKYCVAH